MLAQPHASRIISAICASDSGSRLGKIKNADQGLFSVEDRDQENQHLKTVRVVSSIEYYLTD